MASPTKCISLSEQSSPYVFARTQTPPSESSVAPKPVPCFDGAEPPLMLIHRARYQWADGVMPARQLELVPEDDLASALADGGSLLRPSADLPMTGSLGIT